MISKIGNWIKSKFPKREVKESPKVSKVGKVVNRISLLITIVSFILLIFAPLIILCLCLVWIIHLILYHRRQMVAFRIFKTIIKHRQNGN